MSIPSRALRNADVICKILVESRRNVVDVGILRMEAVVQERELIASAKIVQMHIADMLDYATRIRITEPVFVTDLNIAVTA